MWQCDTGEHFYDLTVSVGVGVGGHWKFKIVSSFVWTRLISFCQVNWTLRGQGEREERNITWSTVLVLSQLPPLEQTTDNRDRQESALQVEDLIIVMESFTTTCWSLTFLFWLNELQIFFSSLMTRQIFYIILWSNNFHSMFSQYHDINSIGKTNGKYKDILLKYWINFYYYYMCSIEYSVGVIGYNECFHAN